MNMNDTPRKSKAEIERELFSARLRRVLEYAGCDGRWLERQINEKFKRPPGDCPVRKWLTGEAIPPLGTVQMLADWLGVSSSWLRYGDGRHHCTRASPRAKEKVAPENVRLLADLAQLSARDAHMIRTLVSLMVKEKVAA